MLDYLEDRDGMDKINDFTSDNGLQLPMSEDENE